MSDAFTRLALKGEPHDLGYQHGTRLAAAIADNVEVYFSLFKHYAGLDRGGVRSRLRFRAPDRRIYLSDGVMLICKGQPCEGQYEIETFDEGVVEPQSLSH